MFNIKKNKSERKKIRGMDRCACKYHKCSGFTRYEDRLCDKCYNEKIKCAERNL